MLAKLLRSKLRAKVLGILYANPDKQYYVRQLQSLTGQDSTNISRELSRLESIGVIMTCHTEGRQKYYKANPDCPIFMELHQMVLKTEGLADVLRESLQPVADQLELCFVYGSLARGEATAASDVDLLVAGDVDEIELHKAIGAAEVRLARPINYTLLSLDEYNHKRLHKSGFFAQVFSGPKIEILGDAEEI